MIPKTSRLLIVAALAVGVLIVVAIGLLVTVAPTLEALAPAEFTADAALQFQREFPDIYHFLLRSEGYEITHFRVQRGLGGRWGKLSLRRTADTTVDREQARARLAEAFAAHGWTVPATPHSIDNARNVFEIEPGKQSKDDLIYTHAHLPGPVESASHTCWVYVAPDASEIVAYCEMGW